MKYFLVALIFLLTSGCNFDNREYATIISFESTENGCDYRIRQESGIPEYDNFTDDCGKFNIGDRVKWVKQ